MYIYGLYISFTIIMFGFLLREQSWFFLRFATKTKKRESVFNMIEFLILNLYFVYFFFTAPNLKLVGYWEMRVMQ